MQWNKSEIFLREKEKKGGGNSWKEVKKKRNERHKEQRKIDQRMSRISFSFLFQLTESKTVVFDDSKSACLFLFMPQQKEPQMQHDDDATS